LLFIKRASNLKRTSIAEDEEAVNNPKRKVTKKPRSNAVESALTSKNVELDTTVKFRLENPEDIYDSGTIQFIHNLII
jgi:hypothetical protein